MTAARILVADRAATTRIRLKVRLLAACYQVCTADSSEDLLHQARAKPPDLIILGESFAEDGPSMIAHLPGSDPEGGAIPVLMLAGAMHRLAALRAGIAAVLDPTVNEQMLLARIRGLLRDSGSLAEERLEMAEPPTSFTGRPAPAEIALVADSAARALRWRHLLQDRLPCRLTIRNPEEALAAAATHRAADLYLIAADIDAPGDGLRLLSELRSRAGSRDSAFVIATPLEPTELSAMALDLGAGEVLPLDLGGEAGGEIAALALQTQLSQKARNDRRRAEAQRNMLWAMIDPLTGLYNRRYALPRLAATARDAARDGLPLALLVLDLDRFKRINDSYGHAAGDAVLCEMARRLDEVIGTQGVAARLGGEEFLAILPGMAETPAYRLAEEIRLAAMAAPVPLPGISGGGQVDVTLSAGIAVARPGTQAGRIEQMAERALERADRALMMAKSIGRNRVMLAQGENASCA